MHTGYQKNPLKFLQWVSVFVVSIAVLILAILYRDQLSHLHTLGLFGIFLANLLGSAIPFVPVPGIVTVVVGGTLYSPLAVAVLATLGAVIGDIFCYFIGLSGEKLLESRKQVYTHRLTSYMRRYGGLVIFIFALVPNPIFDAIGVIAGLLEYPVPKFIFWLFIGRLLRNILLAFFGAQF